MVQIKKGELDAAVTIYLVNWQDVSQRVILRSSLLGQVSRGRLAFTIELRGLAAKLDQAAGRTFQRSCARELGDARCAVDLTAAGRHGAGTVVQVLGAFDFTASGLGSLATGPVFQSPRADRVGQCGPAGGARLDYSAGGQWQENVAAQVEAIPRGSSRRRQAVARAVGC